MSSEESARRHPRVALGIGGLILEDRCFEPDGATILNLSLGGAFVVTSARPAVGRHVRIILRIEQGKPSHIEALVTHEQPNGVGVKFMSLDEGSRRLIAALTDTQAHDAPSAVLGRMRDRRSVTPENSRKVVPLPTAPRIEAPGETSSSEGEGLARRVRRMLGI